MADARDHVVRAPIGVGTVVAAIAALAYLVLDPPSADLAAQEYRAGLGLVLWDNGWYAGHHMPAYSVLFPLLASLLGPRVVGALAAVAATLLFERVAAGWVAPTAARVGSIWFAAGTAAMLVSGRLTFALGVAVALGAVLALQRERPGLASGLAVLTSLASPVAGAFLALAGLAWWLSDRRRAGLAVAGTALATAIALGVAFPEGGSFPFVASAFWPPLALMVAVVVAIPREQRLLRVGAALYVVAMVASFALDTPMGGNVVRLGTLAAGPLLACALWARDRRLLLLLALPLLYWQWRPPVDDWVRASGDPTVQASAYDGLLGFLRTRDGAPFRVEVPFTDNHWDPRHIAPAIPMARGWERQLDIERNPLFYDGRPLTAARYRAWLDEHAVAYVALADAPIDASSAAEAALVRSAPSDLRLVWRDALWRVYAVRNPAPLARGTATVTALEPQAIELDVRRPGVTTIQVRHSPYWRLSGVAGCVERASGGWLRVRAREAGPARLTMRFALGRVGAGGPRCEP